MWSNKIFPTILIIGYVENIVVYTPIFTYYAQ